MNANVGKVNANKSARIGKTLLKLWLYACPEGSRDVPRGVMTGFARI